MTIILYFDYSGYSYRLCKDDFGYMVQSKNWNKEYLSITFTYRQMEDLFIHEGNRYFINALKKKWDDFLFKEKIKKELNESS